MLQLSLIMNIFNKKSLLLEILIFSVILAFLHYLAITFFLYWTIEWFDILMHFLGGFVLALIAMFLFYTSGYMDFPKDHIGSIFAMTISFVLLIGLVWELWELFIGFTDVLEDQGDTLLDLIMDTIGGIIAFSYGKKKIWQK